MSTENIQAFFKKAEQDSSLQQKLQAIPREPKEDAVANLAKLSTEVGLPFTVEEFLHATSESQLSNEELEGLSGGLRAQLQTDMGGVYWKGVFIKDNTFLT